VTTLLSKRFHEEEYDELYKKSMHLKQKRSVNDYTHEWEVLKAMKSGFKDEQMLKMLEDWLLPLMSTLVMGFGPQD
jgi:hypothetical protein